VSDLSSLSEFKDIAVIQKRFLPKTQRFEGFGGINGILNDKFFTSVGLNGRLGYHFTERLGVELLVMILATGERDVTKSLRQERGVVTTNFVSPQNYYGADIRWTPVYGKMSFLNNKITTFDLYFSAGAGITNTNQGGSEPTIHMGTGQVFAITKSAAFRWDFSWNFYNAKSGVAGAQQNSLYNNLFLTLGASFFFPEATYR
jgi:outer membrane beta-barrel protein